jgi:hypothetical protein
VHEKSKLGCHGAGVSGILADGSGYAAHDSTIVGVILQPQVRPGPTDGKATQGLAFINLPLSGPRQSYSGQISSRSRPG